MYNVFDVIKNKDQMYLFLGKYKIFFNKKLIENYRDGDINKYVYVKINEVPIIDGDTIKFSDNYMFELLKNKRREDDVVKRLSMKLFDNINLEFNDKRFTARRKMDYIDEQDIELLSKINSKNYLNIVKLIRNVNSLTFNFSYDKNTKLYENSIYYYDKVYKLRFINDDFVFNILTPLINELMLNSECKCNNGEDVFAITSQDSFDINVSNFNQEIILYLVEKFNMMDNNKRI